MLTEAKPNRSARRSRIAQLRGFKMANRKYNDTRAQYERRVAGIKARQKKVEAQKAKSKKRNDLRKKIGKEFGVNYKRVVLLSKLDKGVDLKYTIRS